MTPARSEQQQSCLIAPLHPSTQYSKILALLFGNDGYTLLVVNKFPACLSCDCVMHAGMTDVFILRSQYRRVYHRL